MPQLQKNTVCTVVIEGYSSEGLGIARIDGQVVFVHGAVRGETCEIRIVKVLKNIAFGKVETIITPSNGRGEVDCPHFPACGGCQTRHLTYEEELSFKRQKVEDALRRLGGADLTVEEILGSEETIAYRNKSQFPMDAQGRCGFYRARSHQVIPTEHCRLQTDAANAIATAVSRWARAYNVSIYNEQKHLGLLRHVYVRTNREEEALVCIVANGNKLPYEEELIDTILSANEKIAGIVLNQNTKDTNVILGDGYRTLWGKSVLEDSLCDLCFSLSVPSFYQINRRQTEHLYEKALEFADLSGNELVLDLYCGIGTITLCLAKKAKEVIGCEIVPEAIEDAKENARRNHISNASFYCGDASDIAAKLRNDGLRPDVITVDPPRKGLAEDVVETIAEMAPKKIVYVSCDPATLGRDVKRFAPLGYKATRAVAVDLFPRTAHVETVVLLSKLNTEQHIVGTVDERKNLFSNLIPPIPQQE